MTSDAAAEVGEGRRRVPEVREVRRTAFAHGGLRLETDVGVACFGEPKMTHELPELPVEGDMKGMGAPQASHPEPGRGRPQRHRVAVVGRAAGDDGDDGGLALRGKLQSQLGPRSLVVPKDKGPASKVDRKATSTRADKVKSPNREQTSAGASSVAVREPGSTNQSVAAPAVMVSVPPSKLASTGSPRQRSVAGKGGIVSICCIPLPPLVGPEQEHGWAQPTRLRPAGHT